MNIGVCVLITKVEDLWSYIQNEVFVKLEASGIIKRDYMAEKSNECEKNEKDGTYRIKCYEYQRVYIKLLDRIYPSFPEELAKLDYRLVFTSGCFYIAEKLIDYNDRYIVEAPLYAIEVKEYFKNILEVEDEVRIEIHTPLDRIDYYEVDMEEPICDIDDKDCQIERKGFIFGENDLLSPDVTRPGGMLGFDITHPHGMQRNHFYKFELIFIPKYIKYIVNENADMNSLEDNIINRYCNRSNNKLKKLFSIPITHIGDIDGVLHVLYQEVDNDNLLRDTMIRC